MVRFDTLELLGFKSFADKTRLNFKDRITAILGPNGCGKSNVADSIGWVLGLQNARNMRGQKIEDVIFSGTEKRRPSGFAEVRLKMRLLGDEPVIWNDQEYTDKQLEVSRRVDRNGDSYYQINQKRCRLKDLTSLMEAVGLGSASYALIAQGEIDSFLTARPLERRLLIEEAAQIHGYKVKRRNAEQKLELAQQNLVRIHDIISEVERNLRSLKRQANKASRYKKLRDEFKGIQQLRFAIEAERLKDESGSLNLRLSEMADREQKCRLKLDAEEKRFQGRMAEREKLQETLNSLQEKLSEMRLAMDRSRNAVIHYREQTENHEAGLEDDTREAEELRASLTKLDTELSTIKLEEDELTRKESALGGEVEKQQREVKSFDNKLRDSEDLLEKERGRLVAASSEVSSVQGAIDQIKSRISLNETDQDRLKEDRVEFRRKLEESRISVEEKKAVLDRESGRLETSKKEIIEIREELKRLNSALEELLPEELDLRNRLIAARERLQSLVELELSRSQYSEGVQQALNHFRKSKLSTAGTFADFVETNPEFEKVVEEFLARELEYVLVDSVDQAVQGLMELRSSDSGKCTFLAVNASESSENPRNPDQQSLKLLGEPGVHGRLGDLLKFKSSLGNAFLRAFPQHSEAIVVSDIDLALKLSGSYPEKTFLTMEGEAFAARGILATSSKSASKLGLLSLKRQKREVETRIESLQKELAKVSRKVSEHKETHEKMDRKREEGEVQSRDIEKKIINIQHEYETARQESLRHESAIRNAESELEQLVEEKRKLKLRLENQTKALSEKKEGYTSLEKGLEQTRHTIQDLRSQGESARTTLSSNLSDQKVVTEKRIALGYTLNRIKTQKIETESRISSVEKRRQFRKSKLEELRLKKIEQQESAKLSEAQIRDLETIEAQSKESLENARKEAQRIESRLREMRAEQAGILENRSALDVENARIETHLHNLENSCREQLKMGLEEALSSTDYQSVENQEEVLQRYGDLSSRLESFGPVNMTAIDEFQENEERFEFLTGQRDDIEKSIVDTKQAIQEINTRSRIQFSKAFKEINKNFNTVFRKLFGGGECGMELMDDEDILDCGIDVIAQPPGKKLQNILLLSGGEKALTVFSLLVGIFMSRPSRFCILDEIDAPLDDANVERFAELITEMSTETQFIVITHNKQTMKSADSLYGVTMEEPGVSKVLTVEL